MFQTILMMRTCCPCENNSNDGTIIAVWGMDQCTSTDVWKMAEQILATQEILLLSAVKLCCGGDLDEQPHLASTWWT